LDVCLHDTAVCQTGFTTRLTTGLTTGCIMYTNIYPVVKPVWQPGWQQVVSCKRGFSKIVITDNTAIFVNYLIKLHSNDAWNLHHLIPYSTPCCPQHRDPNMITSLWRHFHSVYCANAFFLLHCYVAWQIMHSNLSLLVIPTSLVIQMEQSVHCVC